jgi:hypothetical protein
MSRRRAITLLTTIALVGLATFAGPAAGSHAGALADCGTAGTFTVKATDNAAGSQSPTPFTAVVFEGGGVLTVQEISRNGQLLFTRASNGRARNSLTEVTCSFTSLSDGTFTVTGILTA